MPCPNPTPFWRHSDLEEALQPQRPGPSGNLNPADAQHLPRVPPCLPLAAALTSEHTDFGRKGSVLRSPWWEDPAVVAVAAREAAGECRARRWGQKAEAMALAAPRVSH